MAPRRNKDKPVEIPATGKIPLAAALKFAAGIYKEGGDDFAKFVQVHDGWLTATDGIKSVGHAIEEDLSACPQGAQLAAAMARVGASHSITQTPSGLSIRSGGFRAVVPCLPADVFPEVTPDACIAVIDDRVKDALKVVGAFVQDSAPRVVTCSVLLQAGSCVATDSVILVEAWHGVDLPPGLLLPKSSVSALLRINRPLVGFGYSESSVTFWFSPHAWFKTKLYGEQYLNYRLILEKPARFDALPPKFFEAIEALMPFANRDTLKLCEGRITTETDGNLGQGANYEISGLAEGPAFNAKRMGMLTGLVTQADLTQDIMYFSGAGVRAALVTVRN
jgi:hypothetical protein